MGPPVFQDRLNRKYTLLPLALLWLAAHALVLGLILGVKFLTAKAFLVLAMAGALLWWMAGKQPRRLPPPPGMV